jgi:hypothetical protein
MAKIWLSRRWNNYSRRDDKDQMIRPYVLFKITYARNVNDQGLQIDFRPPKLTAKLLIDIDTLTYVWLRHIKMAFDRNVAKIYCL